MAERRVRANRRAYAPKVEALEALRLLDAAGLGLLPLVAPGPAAQVAAQPAAPAFPAAPPDSAAAAQPGSAEWDAALDAWLDEGPVEVVEAPVVVAPAGDVDALACAGLRQLDRYLDRAWARAGVAEHQRDDCTQAVHATMLEQLGRPRFDALLADVGRLGIPRVLNRDTEQGPDFFRAVDMVKKRAIRERTHAALDERAEVSAPRGSDGASASWSGALHDAIDRALSPREADLIRATLEGFSPAEIAEQWGLAPKTVSNEKTRALAKLREALVAELDD